MIADLADIAARLESGQGGVARAHADHHGAFGRLPDHLRLEAIGRLEGQAEVWVDQDLILRRGHAGGGGNK